MILRRKLSLENGITIAYVDETPHNRVHCGL